MPPPLSVKEVAAILIKEANKPTTASP